MLVKQIDNIMPGCENDPRPQVGDVDTVLEVFQWRNKRFYALERFGSEKGFRTDYFATLPPEEPAVVNEREFEGVIYAR